MTAASTRTETEADSEETVHEYESPWRSQLHKGRIGIKKQRGKRRTYRMREWDEKTISNSSNNELRASLTLRIHKMSHFLSCPAGVDLVELLTRVTMHDTAGGGGTDKM